MSSGRIRGITSNAFTQQLVKETLTETPAASKKDVEALFRAAAGMDPAHRHLSTEEASMVRAALAAASVPSGGFDLDAARFTVQDVVKDALKTANPDGIKTYFTSTTDDLGQVLIDEMRAAVEKAAGKRVDIDVMIFAFTDKSIADAMIELAEAHDNVHFHVVTDFSQLAQSGGRQPSRLAQEAKARGLDNLQIKFKKDSPYTWSESAKRPVYHHGSTKGLNHHKGMVISIEGRPETLITGSFNWSKTAADKNYENLFVVERKNPVNRKLMGDFHKEVVAFFNHPDVVSAGEALLHKARLFNALRVANGEAPKPEPAGGQPFPLYVPPMPPPSFDVNHATDENHDKLSALVGDHKLVRGIEYQLATYGPFTSAENLLERVPKLAELDDAERTRVLAGLEFGTGDVQINRASVNELVRALKLSKKAALAIVAKRQEVGDFESIDELRGLPGLSSAVFERIAPRLNDDVGRAFFSSRGHDDAEAGTGYAPVNAEKMVPVMGANGQVEAHEATLSAAALDLMRRAKPGDTVKLALYGLSASTAEYAEIVESAARGVSFQVVLNEAYNGGVAKSLKALGDSGLPIEVRVQKAKTMHEKFGVVNDDLFAGSANVSSSSSSKHSEDRFLIKNNQEEADAYHAEHALLWEKSVPVT